MDYFLSFLIKISPLYLLIALGFIASKKKEITQETISSLLIYILAPVVVFHGIIQMEFTEKLLTLPVLIFGMCGIAALLFYNLGRIFWKDSHKNILAFASAQGNAGYFGIPVAITLFGEESLGIYVFLLMGIIMFSFTIGYLILAEGKHSISKSLKKTVRVPVIYAFIFALIINISGIEINENVLNITGSFTGAYTILGMMIIGMNLSKIKQNSMDLKFITLAFIARFIFWPLFALAIIFMDKSFFHLYDETIYKLIFLISIVPIAANTAVFATEFKIHPEKTAFTVFLSTIFAMIYIPIMMSLYF